MTLNSVGIGTLNLNLTVTGPQEEHEEALQRRLFGGSSQGPAQAADFGRFLHSQQFTEASSTLQLPLPGSAPRRVPPRAAESEPAKGRPPWALNTSVVGMRAQEAGGRPAKDGTLDDGAAELQCVKTRH